MGWLQFRFGENTEACVVLPTGVSAAQHCVEQSQGARERDAVGNGVVADALPSEIVHRRVAEAVRHSGEFHDLVTGARGRQFAAQGIDIGKGREGILGPAIGCDPGPDGSGPGRGPGGQDTVEGT